MIGYFFFERERETPFEKMAKINLRRGQNEIGVCF